MALLRERDLPDMERAVEAVERQLRDHVAPAWERLPASVGLYRSLDEVPFGAYVVVIDDGDPDKPGLLGYHDEEGLPVGKVLLGPIRALGGDVITGRYAVSKTLSHEVVEMFANRGVDRWRDTPEGLLTPEELCDPVQEDYVVVHTKKGFSVPVSNFVYPAYYDEQDLGADTQYDHNRSLSRPFSLSAGGYWIIRDPKSGDVRLEFGSQVSTAEKSYFEHKARYLGVRARSVYVPR